MFGIGPIEFAILGGFAILVIAGIALAIIAVNKSNARHIACPHCGAVIPSQVAVCPKCGRAIVG